MNEIFFLVGSFIFLILGYYFARVDKRTGLIPNKIIDPAIILAVVMQFFFFGFFSFSFYLYFTILSLLYIIFMCLQYAAHYQGMFMGTGDVKLFMFIFAVIPFHSGALVGIPLFNILILTIIIMFFMLFYKMLYMMILKKIPIMKTMYGKSINNTVLRIAPLVYIAFLISFFMII